MKNLTLRQIRLFNAVAHNLNFSRTGREMHMTQPAVSMQIRQMEEHVGLPLFEKLGKSIALTEAGRELRTYTDAIARQLKDAEDAMAALKGLRGGRLNIGMISTAMYFTPHLLAEFCRRHPKVTLKLSSGNHQSVVKQLMDNDIDLAIMGRPPQNVDALCDSFARHPHVVVARPGHALAHKKNIALSRLAHDTFLVREPGSGTRDLLEKLFKRHRLPFNVSMEMSSNETIKQAVMAGMGISFLSLHTIGHELRSGRLIELDAQDMPIVTEWQAVYRRQKLLGPAAQAFRAFLLKEGAGCLVAAVFGMRPIAPREPAEHE
jgi:DNA-binding transcriptional LysR family regulator